MTPWAIDRPRVPPVTVREAIAGLTSRRCGFQNPAIARHGRTRIVTTTPIGIDAAGAAARREHADAVIARNHPGSGHFDPGSFRARLYEDAVWSQACCAEVEWALSHLPPEDMDAQLRWRLFRLFSATFRLYAAHLDPEDVYVIDYQGDGQLHDAMDRFQDAFEAFFQGPVAAAAAPAGPAGG